MKKLVIFDMDGVLLDSEPLYLKMNRRFFKELGADISESEYESFIGISATKMWTYIKEKSGLSQSVEELKELEKELKHETLKEAQLAATDGVTGFLDHLQQNGHTVAIASSGLKKNIDLILQKLNIAKYFDLVVSGEDVIHGKPEPDIFLKVAQHFNRKPEECIVIEDSANGIAAAKAAGMYCIAYDNPNSGKQDLGKADLVVERFRERKLFDVVEQ